MYYREQCYSGSDPDYNKLSRIIVGRKRGVILLRVDSSEPGSGQDRL